MADQIQLRGGTAAESAAFTGASREVTVDTTNNTLRVHDGTTAGGHLLAKAADLTTTQSAQTAALSALGVSSGATSLGTFTGATIGDNLTVKQILQAIETLLETKQAAIGTTAANLGTFSGSTIADNQSIKPALQTLETSLEAIDIDTDDLAALTGISENITNLGTFSGTTIGDNKSVKDALQDLELGVELKASTASPAFTGNLATLIGSGEHPVVQRIQGGFPDINLRTNGSNVALNQNEGRLLWEDAGGGGVAAIKQVMLPTAPMRFFTGGITASHERLRILANGRVGIGETNPAAQLHVGGSVLVKADFPDFQMRSGGERRVIFEDAGGGAEGAVKFASNTMTFFTGGITSSEERLRIAANGRVGIGESDPAAQLHVGGSVLVKVDFPDFQMRSGGERRVIFEDAGGGGEGAIKFASNTMSFFAGGIASGNKIFSIDADSMDVDQTLVLSDGLTLDSVAITAIQTGSESFSDNDTSLMTSAAINDLVATATTTLADLGITSTAAELNILDGVTSTAAELNLLDGVTATTAELNYVDGVTSNVQTQLNVLSALTTVHGGLLNATAGTVSAQVAVIPDANKDISGFRNLSITGDLTVQGTTTTVDTVTMEAANAVVFEGATANDFESTLTVIDPTADRTIKLPDQSGCLPVLAADSTTAITATPAEINILDGVTSTAAELNILDGVTSTAAELNILDGVTATTDELNYVDGVTSAIQTQLDGKYATSGGELTGSVTITTGFPDLTLKSNGERRLLFSDGGGSANAGLKYASSELWFTYGGVASGDVEMKMTNGAIDVINSLKIGGVAITSTAAELNILDGVTATAAELNILDGVTSTAAELNILDGVTSTAAELNILDGVTSTAAELNILDGVTATATELNLLDGVTATTAELNYVDGVTSNIQTQLDALQTADAELTELATMASTAAAAIADLTATEIQILDGATVTTAELNILDGVTSTAAELNLLDGVTATTAELNYVDGVTSAIQTQLDAKLASSGAQAALHVDHIITLSGVAQASDDLGTFSGSTISDSQTIKQALQALETAVEGKQATDAELTELATMASNTAAALADLTQAEVQILDGATVTTAELNILDGVTSTAAELNILDGVTSTAAELNILDGVTSTAAELNILDGVTSTAAELNLVDGITAGTVSASLAVITDSNKDVTGFRNVTLTGELDAATLDISGDADIDGTTNLDAVDIDGAVDIGSGSITLSAAVSALFLTDNSNQALTIAEGGNAYMQFQTNNGAEKVLVYKTIEFDGNVDIDGATQIDATVTVGVDDTGYDVKFFGATASAYMLWDESADDLILAGAAGLVVPDGQLTLGSTAITSTAAELNILDGVTSTTAELNILDGVTSTAAELNILDGVTSTAAELNILDGVTSTAAELNILDGVTASAADINLIDGITNGTVIASKAIITDSDKDITGGRNITITGELDAATLDISGDADIDGTTNLDAVDIDGDVDLAGDLTFSAVKDIKIVDNDAAALEIKQGNNAYMTFGTTNGAELIQISKLLKIDANIGVTNQATDFLMKDNTAAALDITESSNSYLKFDTTNSSELITAGVAVNFAAGLQIGTVAVTASAAELNILDGVTLSAELNILDGVTSTAAELNILDGVTASAADINLIDGITNGTVIASKAIITDSDKDISGGRNITISGELDAATLDISGDADIDGTTNLDAVDIDGAVDMASTLIMSGGLTNAADDTAAASAGVAVNQLYRNGSVVMIRVS